MKKLCAALLALACALAGLPAQASAAAEYQFSLNLPIPPIHTRWKGPIKTWVEEIEKRSNGRIKFEVFFAEALSPRSEAFESVKSGIADFTECAYEANAGQFPFHEGILSVMTPGRYLANCAPFLQEMYTRFPQVKDELKGVKLLFTHASTSMFVSTKSKDLAALDAFKGAKIQANSALIAERLKALGVSVVNMPMSDIYTAMEQGVIDGTTQSFELMVSRRFGDQAKYVTPISLQNTLFYIIMNEDLFNSLPADIQKILEDVSGEFADKAFQAYWESTEFEAQATWVKTMGGKAMNVLSDAEYAKAEELMRGPVDAWFKSLDKHGLPGNDIKKAFYELEVKYSVPWKDSPLYDSYRKLTAK